MSSLWQSCLDGNLLSAKECLDRGDNVNWRQSHLTCLSRALKSENKELVTLLLEQPGIDVNAKEIFGRTALHWAAGPFGTPATLRLLLDFPGIDREAKANDILRSTKDMTPLMESILYGTASQFAEFLKTPEILLNDGRLPSLLEGKRELQNMFSEEQRKRENEKEEERRGQEKVKREEKNKKRGQKRKREIFNEVKKLKELKLARRRQKAAVEELIKKNKEAEEEMSKEGMMRKERVEKEFQDKVDALAREIKILDNEKQKMVVQMDQELVERQETLSKENQDELNNLVKKHKTENADMLENILGDEAEEDGEDAAQAGEQQVNIDFNVEHVFKDENGREVELDGETIWVECVPPAPQAPAAPNCPICFELMTPPTRIFQCGAGHLVCGTCRPRLKECPSRCGQPMSGPAIGLEHFIGQIWALRDAT